LAPALFGAVACGPRAGQGPGFATATDLPDVPRRPDGVVVDPSSELPIVEDTADVASAIVALKPPLPGKAARIVVAAFFHAITGEDLDALSDLLTPDANAPSRSRSGSTTMVDHWRARMRHFHYRTLANDTLYQDADIELYRFDDLETLAAGRPLRPPEMTRSDLLVRVPMLVVRAGDRVFGDEIVFVLRRDKERFRIRQILEDFQLP
jgi:hypothetical protein